MKTGLGGGGTQTQEGKGGRSDFADQMPNHRQHNRDFFPLAYPVAGQCKNQCHPDSLLGDLGKSGDF